MKVLVFRGGALGDLILTLPVLVSLRRRYPDGDLRLFGPLPQARLGVQWVDAVYDVQAHALTPLFAEGSRLDAPLLEVIGGADLVVSYLYDFAAVVASNFRRAGVRRLVAGPHRMNERGPHAVEQLAAPLASLGIPLSSTMPRLEIKRAVSDDRQIDLALHLGSGSSRKNWPWERWKQLIGKLQGAGLIRRMALVAGEADAVPTRAFLTGWRGPKPEVWDRLPLPELSVRLAASKAFFGHDSGMSHLAAAAGVPVLALFGPTNPVVWAPRGPLVQVVASPTGEMPGLELNTVEGAARSVLRPVGEAVQKGR